MSGIGWWGSSSGYLGSVEYLFIAFTPGSTLTRSGSAYLGPVGQIDLFRIYLYLIGLSVKKNKKKTTAQKTKQDSNTKIVNMNINDSLTSTYKITMPLKSISQSINTLWSVLDTQILHLFLDEVIDSWTEKKRNWKRHTDIYIYIYIYRERERERERDRDRQTERDRDRDREKERDIYTYSLKLLEWFKMNLSSCQWCNTILFHWYLPQGKSTHWL